MVKEIATNPHTHCVILYPNKTESLRRKFKARFPNYEGNKHFIIQYKEDKEAQYRYVCKGEQHGYTKENPNVLSKSAFIDVEHYHNAYWEVNEKLPKKDNEKREKESFSQMVLKDLKRLDRKWEVHEVDRRIIYDKVMKSLGEKVKVLDVIIVKRLVYGIHNALCPAKFADDFYNTCF